MVHPLQFFPLCSSSYHTSLDTNLVECITPFSNLRPSVHLQQADLLRSPLPVPPLLQDSRQRHVLPHFPLQRPLEPCALPPGGGHQRLGLRQAQGGLSRPVFPLGDPPGEHLRLLPADAAPPLTAGTAFLLGGKLPKVCRKYFSFYILLLSTSLRNISYSSSSCDLKKAKHFQVDK